jgi:uncharacterized protein YceH (UPF0502 family)
MGDALEMRKFIKPREEIKNAAKNKDLEKRIEALEEAIKKLQKKGG